MKEELNMRGLFACALFLVSTAIFSSAQAMQITVADPTYVDVAITGTSNGLINVAAQLPQPMSQYQVESGDLQMIFGQFSPTQYTGSTVTDYVYGSTTAFGCSFYGTCYNYNYYRSAFTNYYTPASAATLSLSSGNTASGTAGDYYSNTIFANEHFDSSQSWGFGGFNKANVYYTESYDVHSGYAGNIVVDILLNAVDLAEIKSTGSLGYVITGSYDQTPELLANTLTLNVTEVPLPGSLTLFASGIAGLTSLRRFLRTAREAKYALFLIIQR